jgi:hypothetical protein
MQNSTNHEHILSRAAQNQHLWKFSGELSHKSDSFLDSINDFKRLMRQIAKYRSDGEAVVEYVLHLIRQTDGNMILKFVASLPLSQKTGDETFIHESELEAVVYSLWEGDAVNFAAYQPDALINIADYLGYPASGSLATKMVMSKGVITGHAGAGADNSYALCGE